MTAASSDSFVQLRKCCTAKIRASRTGTNRIRSQRRLRRGLDAAGFSAVSIIRLSCNFRYRATESFPTSGWRKSPAGRGIVAAPLQGSCMPIFDYPLSELQSYPGRNPRPEDFDEYWNRALTEMRAVEPNVTLTPYKLNAPFAECFNLYFTGVGGARVHAKYLRPLD